MKRIVVVGDSLSGKSTFIQGICNQSKGVFKEIRSGMEFTTLIINGLQYLFINSMTISADIDEQVIGNIDGVILLYRNKINDYYLEKYNNKPIIICKNDTNKLLTFKEYEYNNKTYDIIPIDTIEGAFIVEAIFRIERLIRQNNFSYPNIGGIYRNSKL